MAPLYRLATGALLHATPRKVISTSFGHSAVLSSAVLSTEPFEPPNAPVIFDIFDASVQLRERDTSDEPLKAFNSLSTVRGTSKAAGPMHSKSIHTDVLSLPWSLPSPVTFDGPACPPHMSPSTLKKRRQQRQNLTARGVRGSSAASYCAFTSQSPPLYKLFDGPSRITRYRYPTSQNEWPSFTYVSLTLCLSCAFGWLTLKDNLDFLQQNDVRSP